MHRIRFPLALRSRSHWGLQRSPDPQLDLRGLLLSSRGGEAKIRVVAGRDREGRSWGERKGRLRNGEVRGREGGGEGRGREVGGNGGVSMGVKEKRGEGREEQEERSGM